MALHIFTLPAGTPQRTEHMGARLKADAVLTCDERDAWLREAVPNWPQDAYSTSFSHLSPVASKPAQAISLPEMSTTNNSSLESKNCINQSRTCVGVEGVSTIQVVVNLHQQVGKV